MLVRQDLLAYLKKECATRQATVLYATHIFDGLGSFPSHIAHISEGTVVNVRDLSEGFPEFDEMVKSRTTDLIHNSPLLLIVEKWLREDYKKINAKRIDNVTGKLVTRWEVLSENMKEYGDKYYNYYNN